MNNEVKKLIDKAANAPRSEDSMRYSQAACNAANAIVASGIAVRPNEEGDREELIEKMAQRFLLWKLPDNFNPDAGITFEPDYNVGTNYQGKHEPIGTNLLGYDQAIELVRYMLAHD